MEINSLPFIQRNVLTNLEKRITKGKKANTFADTLQDASQQVERLMEGLYPTMTTCLRT